MANKLWLGNESAHVGDLNRSANYSPSGVPASGDNLTFPAGAPAITTNLTSLNNSALSGALGAVVFEPGFAGAVGTSSLAPFQFSCSRFEFSGSGLAYIDLEASAIAPEVRATAASGSGYYGLNLVGSALTTLNVVSGSVSLALAITQTSTVATIRSVGSNAIVYCGSGLSLTTFYQEDGNSLIRCAATTITCYGGKLQTIGTGAVTTLNARGGTIKPESTGTITTVNADSGETDATGSGAARTWTTLKINPGAIVTYDPAVLTVTNRSAPDYPTRFIAKAT